MRRALTASLLVLVAVPGAHAKAPRPVVKSVSPLQVSVGEVMTVTGRHFKPGTGSNVVVFVNRRGKVVYVRADGATEDSLSLRLPKRVERLLDRRGGKRVPTRFRVKVISTRMGKLSRRALAKPSIGPDVGGDCDRDGQPNPVDEDDDNDLLTDAEEKRARTNPCNPDSDGDRLLDGWEYLSALDLNRKALPYPGKRPYPNALQADATIDYDGDGLYAWAEHAMWWLGERRRPLSYSDGDQSTRPEPAGSSIWDWNPPFGELEDDERDFDGDGLSNIAEMRMYHFQEWENLPSVNRPDFLDPDSDGDGLKDGLDDQDHDDVSNLDEIVNGTWAMNPCDPDPLSRTCPRWLEKGMEPVKPEQLCLSRTLANGGSVRWFEYEPPEVEGEQSEPDVPVC